MTLKDRLHQRFDEATTVGLDALSKVQLSGDDLAEAAYRATNRIQDFLETVVNGVLRGQLAPTPRERALLHHYWRLYMGIADMVQLNALRHIQATATTARTIFEVSVDLRLLMDADDRAVARYHAWTRIERYRRALAQVDFADSEEGAGYDCRVDVQRQAVQEEALSGELRQLAEEHWPGLNARSWPVHWHDPVRLAARVRAAGMRALEVRSYKLQSWLVHPGGAAMGLQTSTYEAIYAESHFEAMKCVQLVLPDLFRAFHLHDAVEGINRMLAEVGGDEMHLAIVERMIERAQAQDD